MAAFTCDIFAYQVVQPELSPGVFGNSQFRKINTVNGDVEIITYDTGFKINAIGYNTLDNFIYGFATIDLGGGNFEQHLVRIEDDGSTTDLGTVPNFPISIGLNTGAIDEQGFLYVKNALDTEYYTIDLRPTSATFGQMVDPTAGYILATPPYYTSLNPLVSTTADWAYNPVDGQLYAVLNDESQFISVNPTNGVVTFQPTISNPAGLPLDYGAMFSDADGFIYGISNSTGEIIRWQNTGANVEGELFSQTLGTIRNDAASCVEMRILLDFGDAPDTSLGNGTGNYSTLLISGGPRHLLRDGLTLGTLITSESDAYENANATGDDLVQGVQDDAIVLPVPEILVGQDYSVDITYTNSTGENANIYAWIDFNMDGIFQLNEAATPISVSSSATNPRTVTLNFTQPVGTILAPLDTTFMRIRITTENLINGNNNLVLEDTRSIGVALDGEVEDYLIEVTSLNIEGTVWYDTNCNGIRDVGEPLAEGIVVELYEESDLENPIDFTTTDANGFYEFNNLNEGVYYVKVIKPDGYEFTLVNVGANDSIDSDVNKTNGISEPIDLNRDNQLVTIDAGLCRLNKISGQAFYDCNNNGILDDGEPFLCGVPITLINEDGIEVETVITDCDGYYEFKNLEAGTYTIRVVAPPGTNIVTPVPAEYYGSKPDSVTGEFQVPLTTFDYLQGFVGFKGDFKLDNKYCIKCNQFNNYGCGF